MRHATVLMPSAVLGACSGLTQSTTTEDIAALADTTTTSSSTTTTSMPESDPPEPGTTTEAASKTTNRSLSEHDLVGVWQSNDGIYVQFNEDGTSSVAPFSTDRLDTSPMATGTYRLEGNELFWSYDDDSMSCPGADGHYEVALGVEGELEVTVIEDDCGSRAADLRVGR